MKENKWKTIAIIFITLFILEMIIMVYFYNVGSEMLKNEETCALKCDIDNYCSAYYYDDYTEICMFYNNDGEIYKEFQIGG